MKVGDMVMVITGSVDDNAIAFDRIKATGGYRIVKNGTIGIVLNESLELDMTQLLFTDGKLGWVAKEFVVET